MTDTDEAFWNDPVPGSTPDVRTYIALLRPYLLIIIILFVVSVLAGYMTGYFNPEIAEQMMGQFEESYDWIADESPLVIMLFIFANNTINSFIAMLLGVVFGLWPILFILINGFFIGIVVFDTTREISIFIILAALIPHGIIELPMIFISAAIGLRLGYLTFLKISKQMKISIKQELFQAVRFFIKLIVPLLFIAAFIETFVTSAIPFILMS
ncbi:MAG: stage II sporulation protein M [Methanosarcinales archaeon]|nr:stage II sporulation protein M [Methanosarcinales archaeon]